MLKFAQLRSKAEVFAEIAHNYPWVGDMRGGWEIEKFDFTVFDRPLTGNDYRRRTGPVYQLVWGRKTTPAGVATFADKVGAKLIIVGHQPQESGYAVVGDRLLIIASDHNQGVFVSTDLSQEYDMDKLVQSVHKFVAVDVD